MCNIKPIEKGNAQTINEICLPINPAFTLLRYEAITNFYSEEPQHIYLKLRESDKRCLFEQVFRLRVRIPNQMAYAWIIYSNSREWLNEDGGTKGLIIRNVIWERSVDSERVKEIAKSNREVLLTSWPELQLSNIYLNPQVSTQLIDTLLKGDNILSKGIVLEERASEAEQPEWYEIEIRRLFDWGNVQALWSPDMENKDLERFCFNLNEKLKTYINKDLENVYQMDLDFIYPPNEYKRLVFGDGCS